MEDLGAADVLKKTLLAAEWEMEDSRGQDHCELLLSLHGQASTQRGRFWLGGAALLSQRSGVLVAIVFYLVCVDVHVP